MQHAISRIDRRRLLQTSLALGGLAGLEACTTMAAPTVGAFQPAIAPVRARTDRIFDITVCLRPFRAAGPRLDTETIGIRSLSTITAMAAAAGRCPGAREPSR